MIVGAIFFKDQSPTEDGPIIWETITAVKF